MDDTLLDYYERELTFIRAMGAEFARKYPKVAGRLLLEPDKCDDPHTERLIEAFALISGRIHKKIDDGLPEITESFLNILYPHYVNPIPSMAIVQFDPARKTISPVGHKIDKNTVIYSKPIGGTPCQFTTSYPVTLWPVEVVEAELRDPKRLMKNVQQAIAIRLKTFNQQSISQLAWDRFRFFLNGPSQHVFHLYELLSNHVTHIECESTNREGDTVVLPLDRKAIQPVGFEPQEAMIPTTGRSFPGYVLLFEYFCFPEKFLFLDLTGLAALKKLDCSDTLTIWIYLDRIAKANLVVNANTFCAHATPAINLFHRIAEPIRVEHRKPEYHVIADVRRREATEVFGIDRVTAIAAEGAGKTFEFKPFYSIRHQEEEEDGPESRRAFWHPERRPSGMKGDDGTEVYISFTDLRFDRMDPEVETLTVHVTCTNRDLPARLPFGDPTGDFDMETAAPVMKITSLIKPTPTRRPTLGGALQWHLVSHLSLNHLSLVQGGEDALREILRLYDFDRSPAVRQQIDGIVSVRSGYVTKRIGRSFCRGVQTTIELDEDKFVGTGLFLFGSVLERFLGLYVSINSFSQMVLKALQKKEPLRTWAPRNGSRILL
jgi:type VI secretion system protein ImpG